MTFVRSEGTVPLSQSPSDAAPAPIKGVGRKISRRGEGNGKKTISRNTPISFPLLYQRWAQWTYARTHLKGTLH